MPTKRTLGDIMTVDVCSVDENDNLLNLLEAMHLLRFRHTPVTDGDKLIGLVTERALLQLSASNLLPHAQQSDRYLLGHFRVRDVMTREVITAKPNTLIKDAVSLMLRQRIGCLPIVNDHNQLLGIVTTSDIMKLIAELAPAE